MVFGWLIDKKGYVMGYYGLEQRGNKVRTDMGMEYPVSWLHKGLSDKRKERFAEELRKLNIENIYWFTTKDPTYSKQDIRKMVLSEKERSWKDIINDYIESKKEQYLSNYAQRHDCYLINYQDGYNICNHEEIIITRSDCGLSLAEVQKFLEELKL